MATARPADTFDVDLFETRLEALKDTQDGIQQMSSWCLQHRAHHKKIVLSWLNVFKRVRVEHRLVLFYLANDVIQYSKRKRYEFVESWATALQKATTMVRDERVKNKILRIFNIWEQREIYNEEYLSDLCGLLNITPPKKSQIPIDSDDFQNTHLINTVRECVELSEMTDKSFKKLPKLPNWDIDNIKQQLKDKTHSDDVEKEIERYITYMEAFNKNLQTEIKSRKMVLNHLDTAIKFYANQRGEVKVVVSAYKNFGSRIKLVKKKLDEISPNLPSPIPSPDINAPSPEPDADLQLPDEQTPISMNFLKTSFNGYSSYLDGNLPFDINDFKRDDTTLKASSQPIEVIGSRIEEENNFNSSAEYYKTDSISAYPGSSNMQIPGLSAVTVPTVPTGGYTSLARAAQQYTDVLPPPPNPPLFGTVATHVNSGVGTNSSMLHNINSAYATNYNNNTGYGANSYNNGSNGTGGSTQQPLLPPPPLPNLDVGDGNGNNNLNSTWDMDMSWTNPLDTSMDTPVSPPRFEQEAINNSVPPIEYNEEDSALSNAQDVDHRQLHLPAFGLSAKLGLSKEKSRQLDIDHRNLISLTGSPGTNDGDKKSWLTAAEEEFKNLTSGDVDYRTFGQSIKTIETTTTTTLPNIINTQDNSLKTNITAATTTNRTCTSTPPDNNNKSPSLEPPNDEIGLNVSGGTSYDPTDMVVDMDMSDEDLDDIFREVIEQNNESTIENLENNASSEKVELEGSAAEVKSSHTSVPLLETPNNYGPPGTWEPTQLSHDDFCNENNNDGVEMDMNQTGEWQQHQINWNNNNNNNNNNNMRGGLIPPPPPRPPFPQMPPFGYNDGCGGLPYMGGRNGPRGNGSTNWVRPFPPNPFPRPPRGSSGGGGGHMMASPYFNHRAGSPRGMGLNGKMRGNPFRGGNRFRGKSNWI